MSYRSLMLRTGGTRGSPSTYHWGIGTPGATATCSFRPGRFRWFFQPNDFTLGGTQDLLLECKAMRVSKNVVITVKCHNDENGLV